MSSSKECVACGDRSSKRQPLFRLNCEHCACKDCLRTWFTQAQSNEFNWPAKCCEVIEVTPAISKVLGSKLARKVEEKRVEFETPPARRTYCNACKEFLPASSTATDLGPIHCSKCEAWTCGTCKERTDEEETHDCKGNPEDNALFEQLSKDGYKKCPNCGIMIKLTEACNHMTCRYCRHQFCFVCLRSWGSWGDERHECQVYNQPGTDANGYTPDGFHHATGLDRQGYDREGYNSRGINRQNKRRAPRTSGDESIWAAQRLNTVPNLDEIRPIEDMTEEEIDQLHAMAQVHMIDNAGNLTAQELQGWTELINDLQAHFEPDDEDDDDEEDEDDGELSSDIEDNSEDDEEAGEGEVEGDTDGGNAENAANDNSESANTNNPAAVSHALQAAISGGVLTVINEVIGDDPGQQPQLAQGQDVEMVDDVDGAAAGAEAGDDEVEEGEVAETEDDDEGAENDNDQAGDLAVADVDAAGGNVTDVDEGQDVEMTDRTPRKGKAASSAVAPPSTPQHMIMEAPDSSYTGRMTRSRARSTPGFAFDNSPLPL